MNDRAETNQQNNACNKAVCELLSSEQRTGHKERRNDDHLGGSVQQCNDEVEYGACNRAVDDIRIVLEIGCTDEREHDMGRRTQCNDCRRGKKEANGCADADRYGNRRRDEHAEEYGNVACQREGHRAKYDTRHKHRDNNANGTKNTGQHHVVQLVFRHSHK